MLKKIKLTIRAIKSEQFKTALNVCTKEFKRIKLQERKDAIELKQAYKKERLSQAVMYDEERKEALTRLFTQAIAAYKAEQVIDEIKTNGVTIYDF